ncbi:MAG: hypothetical protein AAF317_10200, partial [Pseudomonadota bacterium]
GALIRAREPRLPEIEGDTGTYRERGKITKKTIGKAVELAKLSARGAQKLSNFYENDHIPEQSLGKKVKAYVDGDLTKAVKAGRRKANKGKPKSQRQAGAILGDIDKLNVGKNGEELPTITVYRPIHRQKTSDDAGRRNYDQLIQASLDMKPDHVKMVEVLRAGIANKITQELESITQLYSDDTNATKLIRGKLRKGIRKIGDLNADLYGITPNSAPSISRAKKKDGAGSNLPLEGDGGKIPNFSVEEGRRVNYGSAPEGFGNYIEYDHIVEATLAEKARDLMVIDKSIKKKVQQDAHAQVMKNNAGRPKDKLREAITRMKGRVATLSRAQLFETEPISAYDRDAAGTVALYRPVHREVTAKQGQIRGGILKRTNIGAAEEKLARYSALSRANAGLLNEAKGEIKKGIKDRFKEEMKAHSAYVEDEYKTEMKDAAAINTSKEAVLTMMSIGRRVSGTMKRLRTESNALLK